MRKKLPVLLIVLALLAGIPMGLLGSASAAASSACETFCSEDLEGCLCCSTCCKQRSGQVICSPGACICP